jgi:arginine decarboxylase
VGGGVLPTPKKVKVVAGAAEGPTPLNAFDNALLAAGIGNLNLMRVSSILPPGCAYDPDFEVPAGSLTPTAYGCLMSAQPAEEIAAAVAVGFCDDDYGVIMEYAGPAGRAAAEDTVARMVRDAFAARGKRLRDVRLASAAHRVVRQGAVVAAAVLWY